MDEPIPAFAPISAFTPRQINRMKFFRWRAAEQGETRFRVVPVIWRMPRAVGDPTPEPEVTSDADHND